MRDRLSGWWGATDQEERHDRAVWGKDEVHEIAEAVDPVPLSSCNDSGSGAMVWGGGGGGEEVEPCNPLESKRFSGLGNLLLDMSVGCRGARYLVTTQ